MKEKSKIITLIILIAIITLSSLPVMAGQASLAYSPKSYNFGKLRQGITNFTTFSIWNAGCYCETLTYNLNETCDWISVYPQSGSTRYGWPDKDTITVTIITRGLPIGYHHCNISINSNRGNKVFTVGVTVIANTTISPHLVFVDDDFDSSIPGWSLDHFNSIQEAINAVDDNGTIYVNNGTYHENLQITKDNVNILHLHGENKNTTIITGVTNNHVIWASNLQVTISGFTIQSSFQVENGTTIDDSKGIVIYNSTGSHIQGNIIQKTHSAISMEYVTDAVIEDNLITHNYKGIILWDSDDTIICNNSIRDNVDEGLFLWNMCENNTVLENQFEDNGDYGIYVDRSVGNVFRLNSVSESHFGLYLYYLSTQYNRITENTFCDNHNGLFILGASNNSIYLNNFVNNTHNYNLTGSTEISNTWDSGYPAGGNYWDDYTGTDNNSDGIGDIPYTIIGDNNQDRYPLVKYPPRYGVKLDCVNTEKTVHPKGNITYEIIVTNTGNIVDNITLTLPPPCKCGWIESLNSYSVELLPNQNTTVLLNVSTIWDLPNYFWYWTTEMTATSQGNPNKSSSLTFNTTIVNYTIVSIEPLSQTITGVRSFTINITVNPNEPIAGIQVNLSFDPNLLMCNYARVGNLFQGNTSYFINGTIDNINGRISGLAATALNGNPYLGGTFSIINFTTRNNSGTSILNLTDVEVGTAEGISLSLKIQNGSVTVVWAQGDINNDGYTNILDLILISQHWGEIGSPGWQSFDINCDGIINIFDAILIGQNWTE